VIALPLLILFVIYANTVLFTALVCGATFLALFEYYAMCLPAERGVERITAAGFGVLLIPLMTYRPDLLTAGMVFSVLFFGLFFLLRFRDLSTVVQHLTLLLFGLLYLPLLLGHLALLRGLPFGREWIFLVLLIVMAGDTAAYFTGVTLGRRKLYPAISPNKSIEGAIGGLAGSLVGALVAKFGFFPALTLPDCLILGIFLGVLGQLGDLFESMLKRSFGVKDSGTIIPGHGGMLDRLDSLLFAIPPAYYYALLRFGGGGAP
jgi:phosphatidate cytidylyltransferase